MTQVTPSCRSFVAVRTMRRGLAHLPGGEDVAELSLPQSLQQIDVGLARNIAGGIARNRAAGDIEAGEDDCRHGRLSLPFAEPPLGNRSGRLSVLQFLSPHA